MQDEVGRGHRFFDEGDVADIALVDFDLVFDVGNIGCRSRGHVVEDRDLVAFFKQGITEVRTDKSGSTGDENAHEVKSIGACVHPWVVDGGFNPHGYVKGWAADRVAHIFDPHTGTIAIGAKSATVLGLGPDGGLTDALATALMVAGEDGAGWFGQTELAEYSAWVIDRHSGGAWGVGPAVL